MVSGTTASQSGTHDGPRASWIKEHRRRATCLDRARRRSAAGRDVQLYLTQQESAAGASAAVDSVHRGAGFRSTSPRFNKLYARAGRPSIAPEKLLRALLLQLLYSVRSERLLMEQLDYNLLFRWFVGLSMDDAVWDASTFSKNRERMLEGDIAEAFFQGVLGEARAGQLLSDEHFTVDGTLLEAWASHKSFRPVDPVGKDNDQEPKPPAARWDENNPTVNYRGEKRTNQTHCSTTDPQAMLARKGPGKEAKLSYHGHLMTENRSGLVVNTQVTTAYGSA